MMLQHFLQEFGYFALFLGTFFEGETILVLAGFLAFRGYMDINLVVVLPSSAATPATSSGISWGASMAASFWRASLAGS
jgi:membrane protein DedA with SNARE-associated domain